MANIKNKPLVSVIVVSYNAADTVIETLNSVLNQTYDNIELILSDDCSKDNTVSLATEWFKVNKNAFNGGAQLLVAEKNCGVCANFNKAIRTSRGQWIKVIAADDILLSDCCKDFVEFTQINPRAHFITSKMDIYDEHFLPQNLLLEGALPVEENIYKKNANEQIQYASRMILAAGPTIFYSRILYNEVGGYDEKYAFEDWPSIISALEHGYKVYFLNKSTVGYRKQLSLSHTTGKLYNIKFKRKFRFFYKDKCWKYLSSRNKLAMSFQWYIEELLEFLHLNYDNKVGRFINNQLTFIKSSFF